MSKQILFDGRADQGFAKSGSTYVNGTDIYQINQEVSNAAAIAIVADPLGVFGSVWRMRLNAVDDFYGATGKARAELSPPNTGSHAVGPPRDNSDIYMAQGVDLWMAWDFMLDENFVFATDANRGSHDAVLIQIHDQPGTSSRVAPWHLILVNGTLELRNSYDDVTENDRLLWQTPAQRGKWYSMVLNAWWDSTAPAAGYMKLWVDRRRVFTESSALNTYPTYNSPGPWPKASGYYYPHGLPSNLVENTVYHRGLRVGTEYTSFTEFMTACGSSAAELEPLMARSISM